MGLNSWLDKKALQRINNLLPAIVNPITPFSQGIVSINNQLTIYPYGNDHTFIVNGYQKNPAVYIVVTKCVKKFGQVPFYHYRITRSERKTFAEYLELKGQVADRKARQEMKKMLTKSVEQTIVDSPLSKFLNKPNRNQSGSRFRGNVYGHKLLTGEGNMWFSYPRNEDGSPDLSKPPLEMFNIPKSNLALVKGNDPWAVDGYKIIVNADSVPVLKETVIMWIFDTFGLDSGTLSHLRGQAPLDAALLDMQSANEAAERLASMNRNQGVAAIAFNESDTRQLTPEQAMFQRKQFNSIINDKDLAGTIAVLTGKWGLHQVGMDARSLSLLEQGDRALDQICMIMDVPIGVFKHGTTYENKPQEGKDFIYNNIAPAAYELRDMWNEKLLPKFGLDRERDIIDCDILSLPDLAEDLKTQTETLKNASWFMTPNEAREYTGYDRLPDPNMDKIYLPSGFETMDNVNADPGGDLSNDVNLLNDNNG